MEIRRAGEADTDVLRRMWDAFNDEATYTPYPGYAFDPSLPTTYAALLAERDATAVGAAYVNLSNPHFGFVFGVYVVPEARRRGVARGLMREAAAVARDAGKSWVVLGVDTANDAARRLYAELGFEDAALTLRAPVDRLLDDA
jgi:ribosomal protein S18 acetylase RimI-like enzyme